MSSRVHAKTTLAILTALNFLNYIDRSVLFAVQPLIQREFGRNDAQMGFLTSSFFICYMAGAPLLGYLADRIPRKPIIILGAVVWSAATLLTAFTWDFHTLLLRHILVGIGEASFVATAPSYIADLFPEEKRGRMLSIFFMGIPVGTALGYLIGGFLGYNYGWRAPFYVVAGPGILMAVAMMLFREPQRGIYDRAAETAERGSLRGLLHNRAFWTATLGMAFMTFALGGMQVWMPTFLIRVRGVEPVRANLFFALITAVNGVVATISGGWFSDWLLRRRQDAYFLVSGAALAVAAPMAVAAIYLPGPAMLPAIFIAEFFLLFNTGPLNAAVVDSVGAGIRASAIAVNLLAIHLLGDALSPSLIGYVSDWSHSLQKGFLTAIAAVVVASIILLWGKGFVFSASASVAVRNGSDF
jgi:predicted MFS family arabinose efflux permease